MVASVDGEITALCITDAEATRNFITGAQLLAGDFPDMCQAELSRKEIEERLNRLESNEAK
jgi:hypothetical protein